MPRRCPEMSQVLGLRPLRRLRRLPAREGRLLGFYFGGEKEGPWRFFQEFWLGTPEPREPRPSLGRGFRDGHGHGICPQGPLQR